MKCLMSMKRIPDMSPESKGEMNQEDTATGKKKDTVKKRSELLLSSLDS